MAHMNVLHVKRMLYYTRGALFGLQLYASHDWGVIIQNTRGSLLLRLHLLHTFGYKLQTIGRILAFYLPNEWATIGDVPSRL